MKDYHIVVLMLHHTTTVILEKTVADIKLGPLDN